MALGWHCTDFLRRPGSPELTFCLPLGNHERLFGRRDKFGQMSSRVSSTTTGEVQVQFSDNTDITLHRNSVSILHRL